MEFNEVTDGISLDDVIEAYYDCRHNKRNTINQLEFEVDYEHNCIELWHELNERRYEPRRSIAFVVNRPVKREIFAADFRDRVVHHLIARRIYPLLEKQFLIDSYATQKGKGTLFGVKRVEQHVKDCSYNYTRDCWIMKLDIQGFFMSIDKNLLINTIMHELTSKCDRISDDHVHTWKEKLDIDFCEYLLHCFLDRNPSKDRIKLGKPSNWIGLPANKQLENSPEGIGIVIGDIISQLFSNINLNLTDQWAKRKMLIEHWGHYVDDHFAMSRDKDFLIDLRDNVLPGAFREIAHVNMHPKKSHIIPADGANQFLGAYIKKDYVLPRQRTIDKFVLKMQQKEYQLMMETPSLQDLLDIRASINSYCGILGHYKSFNLRKKYIDTPAINKYFIIDDDFRKISIRKDYLRDPYLIW